MSILSYGEAINQTLDELMSKDKSIYIIGQGADDPSSAAGPLGGLEKKFPDRVLDVPMSEEAVAGICIGMSMNGLKVINFHIRMDFMLVCMNQIINMASKISYMYAGRLKAPVVFRGMIGKSWGQGPQHSQSLYSMFTNIPGLKVYAPAMPYDAKNVYIKALRDNCPSLIIEHRLLYYQKGMVPPNSVYEKARYIREGTDITLIGVSQMAVECMRAANMLQKIGINAEVITPISLTEYNIGSYYTSVKRTGNVIVVDNDWGGIGSDIIASLHETGLGFNSKRMGFENTVCPTSPTLEKAFYPNPIDIARNSCELLGINPKDLDPNYDKEEVLFKGPF